MSADSNLLGDLCEQQALQFLERHGLTLIEKNYRCQNGEIDLIMRDQSYLVFIEVRLRQNPHYANSLESVTPTKQSRIICAAKHYLLNTQQYDKIDCRFDVLGVDQNLQLNWIKNAFDVK